MLHLYDSKSARIQPLNPVTPGKVGIYLCGATVQGSPHVGHLRAAVSFDTLIRWLRPQRLRGHLRPQRHRHRRQDPEQVGRGRLGLVGLGIPLRARIHRGVRDPRR